VLRCWNWGTREKEEAWVASGDGGATVRWIFYHLYLISHLLNFWQLFNTRNAYFLKYYFGHYCNLNIFLFYTHTHTHSSTHTRSSCFNSAAAHRIGECRMSFIWEVSWIYWKLSDTYMNCTSYYSIRIL